MVNIFHSIDILLFSSLVLTLNFNETKIYYNIALSLSTLLITGIMSFFLELNINIKNDTHFYFIHNLSFPLLLLSIANCENSFESLSSNSVNLFSICISISSMAIYKSNNIFFSKKWPLFFKITIFTLFFVFIILNQYQYQIINVEFFAIIYHLTLLQFSLSSVTGEGAHCTQFGELNIFSQLISFLLLISLSNIKVKDSSSIFEWKQCINSITAIAILLIPVNIFIFEIILNYRNIPSEEKFQIKIFPRYLTIVLLSILYLSLYNTAKYIYKVSTFIVKMIVESVPIRKLIIYWAFVIMCLPIMLKLIENLNSDSKKKKIFTRKIFHLFLIALFFPQILSFNMMPNRESQGTIEFTIISIYLASCIFIYLEVMRKYRYRELARLINRLLVPFLDNKDSVNGLIITHICLLIGISIPLFKEFLLIKDIKDFDIVSATLGIATIGIGDAFSAIFGILFGKMCLPGNKDKTLIGMIAFFISTFSSLQLTCFFSSSKYSLSKLYIISFFSSLLEAYSHYIDNATIPMYSLTLYTNIR
ncbi:phosphatidate cytidylyltransferase family [Cryptosporidium sp. chipmunk genotype I]|uniref:phosphatidate cytidylyltransferase family n=1 Tax=Cryptosporidium sp. chipmunk genotype I TaxID=1280935 RepID=UPI003519EAFB|nr:phosphatidate cytidylyltransferase family [Cryptosporidium sp. chipmunk genotype I]